MWLTFSFVVVIATIVVIFSDEFVEFFKNLWRIGWFKLLVPLAAASSFVVLFDTFVMWSFEKVKIIFFQTMAIFETGFLKHPDWYPWLGVLTIFLLTILPVVILDRYIAYRHKVKRLSYQGYIALILWTVWGMLYINGVVFD